MAHINWEFLELPKADCYSSTENDLKSSSDSLQRIESIESNRSDIIDSSILKGKETQDRFSEENLETICHGVLGQVTEARKRIAPSRKCLRTPSSNHSPCNHFFREYSRQKINETRVEIAAIDAGISASEDRSRRLLSELRRLEKKERRYIALEANYKSTVKKLEQVSTQYRQTILEKNALGRKIRQGSESAENSDISEFYKACSKIENIKKDLNVLGYSSTLLAEDIALEAGMRSIYFRFEETIKTTLNRLDTELEQKKETKRNLQKKLILLRSNSKWFEFINSKNGLEEFLDEIEEIERSFTNGQKPLPFSAGLSSSAEDESDVSEDDCPTKMRYDMKVLKFDKNNPMSRIPVYQSHSDYSKVSSNLQFWFKRQFWGGKTKPEVNGDKRKTRIPRLIPLP